LTEAEAIDNISEAVREYLAVVEEQFSDGDFRETEVTVS